MRLWGWRRRSDAGDEECPEPLDVSAVWDEQLSAHLDGELDEHEAAVVDEAIEADPTLAVRLNELAAVRDALGSLGEVRAPRPFTLEAPPTAARRTPGRLELVFRMGAVAAAVAFAIVLTGDIAGLGGEGVEGWGVRPGFGSGESEQASAAPQAAPAAVRQAATAATATSVATQAASTAPTAQPPAAADTVAAAPTPQPTVAAVAAATAEATAAASALAAPALPTVTRESRVAARSAEPDEAAAAPAAEELPEAAAGAPEASAEEAPAATPAATPAADESADGSGEAGAASEAATPAAAAEAVPAATATVTPAIPDESVQVEAGDGDDAARALRRAEQGLLVAALALVGLTLLLGLWRRRGGAV